MQNQDMCHEEQPGSCDSVRTHEKNLVYRQVGSSTDDGPVLSLRDKDPKFLWYIVLCIEQVSQHP